jgi:hypothetical protein
VHESKFMRLKTSLLVILAVGTAWSFTFFFAAPSAVRGSSSQGPIKQENPKSSAGRGSATLPANTLRLLKHKFSSNDSTCPVNPEKDFRVSQVDLDGDGIPELIVFPTGECFCSPTGNCDFWIYRTTRTELQPILDSDGIQSFKVLTNRTKGYLDISTYSHSSASEGDLKIWKFDGKFYRVAECYEQSWSFNDEKGEQHILKQPRNKRVSCQ